MGFFAGLKCHNIILVLMAVTLASSVMGEDNVPTEPLDWMAGHWCTDSGGKSVEEVWLPPDSHKRVSGIPGVIQTVDHSVLLVRI